MLHIAVCDDDIKTLDEVKQILTDYCRAKKLAAKYQHTVMELIY